MTSTKIENGAVSSPKIVAGGIQANNLAADSVQAGKIAADAITGREILGLSITGDKIAANEITGGHIRAGSVDADQLAAVIVLADNDIVAGDPNGNHVRINAAGGLQQFLDGRQTVQIPPDGTSFFNGALVAGDGVGLGPTIVVDPESPPKQRFYPTASNNQFFQVTCFDEQNFAGNTLPTFAVTAVTGADHTPSGPSLQLSDDAGGLIYTDGDKVYGGSVAVFKDHGAQMSYFPEDPAGRPRAIMADEDGVWANFPMGLPDYGFEFCAADGDPDGYYFYWDSDLDELQVISNVDDSVVKTFVIDHPVSPDEKWLVHATTESPHNGVEYWGDAEIVDGEAVVELPAYFEALCAPDNRQVQCTVILSDEPASVPRKAKPPHRREDRDREDGSPNKVKIRPDRRRPDRPHRRESRGIPQVAASRPKDGRFRIACSGPDGTRVAWLVKAVRKDVAPLVVEPLKADTERLGDGPYTYLRRKPAAPEEAA